jgi:membrane fusion protein, multidrug efflux system
MATSRPPLQEIDFVEGQNVHQGDVLAKIDPRLFQATLGQAKAKKARDQAQLLSAQKDFVRTKTLIAKNFRTQRVVDQTQAKVYQFAAAIDADQAAIENAETQLSYTTIAAPLDGRLGIRLIDRGNSVHAGDPGGLVVVTQVQPIATYPLMSAVILLGLIAYPASRLSTSRASRQQF